jgi:hypothetical protein
MGRHKIDIKKIPDPRGRHVTFNKRKNGLLKKAMELSLLCDCQIALVIFETRDEKTNPDEKINLIQYSTSDMDDILLRYANKEAAQSVTNSDYVKMYGKKIISSSSSSSASSTSLNSTVSSSGGKSKSKKRKASTSTPTNVQEEEEAVEAEIEEKVTLPKKNVKAKAKAKSKTKSNKKRRKK